MFQNSLSDHRIPDASYDALDTRLRFAIKRATDVVVTLCLLLVLGLPMLLIAVLIRLNSRGPAIFIHERVGARRRFVNGRVEWELYRFPFFKFRSMYVNSDQSLHIAQVKAWANGKLEERTEDQEGDAQFKIAHDPRITKVGRWLRKTSLDELPQLFNVLRGEMSLVGPRPVPDYEVAEYREWHFARYSALPGMTGLWQINGRGDVSLDEMVNLDLEYIRKQSFWLDLKILLLTVPAVVSGRGAQ